MVIAGYYTYKFYQDLKTISGIQSVADKSASDKESNSNSGLTKKVAFLEQSVEVEAPDYSHGKIWEYYFDTNKKEKILDGQSILLSPNKIILAYSSNNLCGIVLYNLESKQTNEIIIGDSNDNQNPCWYRTSKWSPDSKYIVSDGGSSPVRLRSVFRVSDTKKIADTFRTLGAFDWVNNTQIAFSDLEESAERDDGTEISHNTNLSMLDISSGGITILKKATTTTDYIYNFVKDGYIYFDQYTVALPSDWTPEKEKANHTAWKVKPDGSNLQQSSEANPNIKTVESLNNVIANYSQYKELDNSNKYLPDNTNNNEFLAVLYDNTGNNPSAVLINTSTNKITEISRDAVNIAW